MHILATQIATLDEAGAAVDLAQSPADMVVLSFSDTDLSALAAAWDTDGGLPSVRLADLKRLRHPLSVDLHIDSVIAHAKAVLVRCLGGLEYWRYGLERIADIARARGILFAALPGDDRPDPRLDAFSTVPPDALARLDRYFREGGPANLREALRYLAALQGHPIAWEEPRKVGPIARFHADGSVTPLATGGDDFIADSGDAAPTARRPTALIVFYRALLMAGDTAPIGALMHALEDEGLAPIAVALTSLKDPTIAAALEALIAAARPRVILNATAFSAMREDASTVLDAADVPVLQVVLAGASREAWAAAPRGLSSGDQAMHVVLPELDGRILTRAISFKEAEPRHPALEYAAIRHRPDAGRVAYVARLAGAWARLAETPRGKRRLALILSDYPARAGRAGYAVGLDTAESAAGIAALLREAGFDIGDGIGAANVEAMLNGADSHDIAVRLALYQEWLAALPESAQRQIADAWGPPAHDPAAVDGAFRFNVMRAGNLVIALQPDRGAAADRKTGYHDAAMPPRHAYVAFHGWLRHVERIHALIHLGTHGTLEWLPGKALALSESCWPEAVLGPVPVIYPFIVNNPGEAVQAKRRIGAVTIGHLTPPARKAGLHGRLAALESLVEEYAAADGFDARRVSLLEEAIVEAAHASGFAGECGLGPADTGRDAVARLDARLCDIKELGIRDSFHVFARAPGAADREALVDAMIAAAPDALTETEHAWLREALAISGIREGEALIRALDGRRVPPGPAGAPTRGRLDVLPTGRNLTATDPRAIPTRTAATIGRLAAEEVIRRHLQDHGDYPRGIVMTLWASASLRTGGDDIAQALHYLGAVPVWDAMSGRVTGVEIVPLAKLGRPRIDVTLRISGLFRDLFEPQIALMDLAVRQVARLDEDDADNPLAAAWRRGDDLARIFGGAPGSYGAGAAAAALDTPWRSRADLGRAALAQITHSYGGWLGDGRAHGQGGTPRRDDMRDRDGLRDRGGLRGDGRAQAFGQADAAPVHGDGSAGGVPHDGFGARLAAAGAIVQPQDTPERDVLDGDDVADFAGGMAAAAALLGTSPSLYHIDSSRPAEPKARTMAESVARAVHGRLANPRWLAGMMAHGHRGIAEIAQGVDALYAFAATADVVSSHLFEAVHDALIADETRFAAMAKRNPAAAAAIARRLDDALARGLWTPRRNAVSRELSAAIARQGRPARAPMEAAE